MTLKSAWSCLGKQSGQEREWDPVAEAVPETQKKKPSRGKMDQPAILGEGDPGLEWEEEEEEEEEE